MSGFWQQITWLVSGYSSAVAASPIQSIQAGIDMVAQGGNTVDGTLTVIFISYITLTYMV